MKLESDEIQKASEIIFNDTELERKVLGTEPQESNFQLLRWFLDRLSAVEILHCVYPRQGIRYIVYGVIQFLTDSSGHEVLVKIFVLERIFQY